MPAGIAGVETIDLRGGIDYDKILYRKRRPNHEIPD